MARSGKQREVEGRLFSLGTVLVDGCVGFLNGGAFAVAVVSFHLPCGCGGLCEPELSVGL